MILQCVLYVQDKNLAINFNIKRYFTTTATDLRCFCRKLKQEKQKEESERNTDAKKAFETGFFRVDYRRVQQH